MISCNAKSSSFHALDRACNDELFALQEIIQNLFAFGIADFLKDDLLRRLRADPAELHRLQRLFDEFAYLLVQLLLKCVRQGNLLGRKLVLVIDDDLPAPESFVFAGFAVDIHPDIHVVLETLLGGRGQSEFKRGEYDVLFDIFFAGKGIDQHQQLAAHSSILQSNVRDQSCLVDFGKPDRHQLTVDLQLNSDFSDILQFPDESPSSIQRQANFYLCAFAYKPRKILRPFQWPVQSWR